MSGGRGDILGPVVDSLGGAGGTETGTVGTAGRDSSAGLTCGIVFISPIGKLDGKDGPLGSFGTLLGVDMVWPKGGTFICGLNGLGPLGETGEGGAVDPETGGFISSAMY